MTSAHNSTNDEISGPPQPPAIRSRLIFTRKQIVGIPLILAVPILAVLGVFGERHEVMHTSSASLDMTLSYPERFHYRQVLSLRADIRNVSAHPLDTVKVSFDTAYIGHFSSVRFDPPAREAYVVDLLGVKPGESRRVAVELWGQDYGRHRGRVVARAGSDSIVTRFSTLVFP